MVSAVQHVLNLRNKRAIQKQPQLVPLFGYLKNHSKSINSALSTHFPDDNFDELFSELDTDNISDSKLSQLLKINKKLYAQVKDTEQFKKTKIYRKLGGFLPFPRSAEGVIPDLLSLCEQRDISALEKRKTEFRQLQKLAFNRFFSEIDQNSEMYPSLLYLREFTSNSVDDLFSVFSPSKSSFWINQIDPSHTLLVRPRALPIGGRPSRRKKRGDPSPLCMFTILLIVFIFLFSFVGLVVEEISGILYISLIVLFGAVMGFTIAGLYLWLPYKKKITEIYNDSAASQITEEEFDEFVSYYNLLTQVYIHGKIKDQKAQDALSRIYRIFKKSPALRKGWISKCIIAILDLPNDILPLELPTSTTKYSEKKGYGIDAKIPQEIAGEITLKYAHKMLQELEETKASVQSLEIDE